MIINKNKTKWDDAYQKRGETLPWCLGIVPGWLKEIIDSDRFELTTTQYKTLDVACGNGDIAAYLQTIAPRKFDVTAIDYSTNAIDIARKKHEQSHVDFREMDVLELYKLEEKYDLVIGNSIFHHIPKDQRQNFAYNLQLVTNDNGLAAICCFSDKEKYFEDKKDFVDPNTGTILHPISKEDLVKTFSPYFDIKSIDEVIYGRSEYKTRYVCLMIKK